MGSDAGAGSETVPDEDPSARARPLFVDTSSLLDLVRDPTRDKDRRETVDAADRLIAAAARGEIEILWPSQVEIELERNLAEVERESGAALKRHWKAARSIDDELAALALSLRATSPDRAAEPALIEDVRALRRERLDRWREAATVLESSPAAVLRALDRLNARLPPAYETKPEFADCLIIEAVFEELDRRGSEAGTGSAVFLTSNTQDYGRGNSTTVVAPPLDRQFEQRGLRHAASFGHAEHLLTGDA